MTDELGSEPHPPSSDEGREPRSAGSFTLKSLVAKILRLFEIQAQIISLRLAATMREVILTAILALAAIFLLLLGLIFLYVAVFKALLLVMGAIAVCLIFAAVHLVGALVILLAMKHRRGGGRTVAAAPAASSGGPR